MVGTLNIISVPEGAIIFLDGIVTIYYTPHTFTDLTAGTHNYKLSLNSYLDISGTVEVIDNQQTNLIVTMPDDFYNKLITLGIATLGVSVLAMLFKR